VVTAASGVAALTAGRERAAGPVLDRLRRIEGQVRGIQRMIERGEECEAILTQVLAARSALDRVAAQVVSASLEECLATRPVDQVKATMSRAVALLARSG
jgi:DNA-binding FrmR family transcriptional regulator